jgi:predicted nucleotidyltransferase
MEWLKHLSDAERLAVEVIGEKVMLLAGDKLSGFYLYGSKARGDYKKDSDVDLAKNH